jgi:hypothetical protein
MNPLLIVGIILFIIILILLYLYYGACKDGHFFSLVNFKCKKCITCNKNQWYNQIKSCKGFSDKKCLNHTNPECYPSQRIRPGTETSNRSCQNISDCYKECPEGQYFSLEHGCFGARDLEMTCNVCRTCNDNEVDLSAENCRGRDLSSGIGFSSRIIDGQWVPISCEGVYDRICINSEYIKYDNDQLFKILFYNNDPEQQIALSNLDVSSEDYNLYYGSSSIPTMVNNIQNNSNYIWKSLSLHDVSSGSTDFSSWKIKSSNYNSLDNCPIENSDYVFFYKDWDNANYLILIVVEDESDYYIGGLVVPKIDIKFTELSSIRDKIHKNFKIESITNFENNTIINNSDFNKYFNLRLVKEDRNLGSFVETDYFMVNSYNSESQPPKNILKISTKTANIANDNFKINFIKN